MYKQTFHHEVVRLSKVSSVCFLGEFIIWRRPASLNKHLALQLTSAVVHFKSCAWLTKIHNMM